MRRTWLCISLPQLLLQEMHALQTPQNHPTSLNPRGLRRAPGCCPWVERVSLRGFRAPWDALCRGRSVRIGAGEGDSGDAAAHTRLKPNLRGPAGKRWESLLPCQHLPLFCLDWFCQHRRHLRTGSSFRQGLRLLLIGLNWRNSGCLQRPRGSCQQAQPHAQHPPSWEKEDLWSPVQR